MLHGCATILLGCICNQVLQLQKLTCLITASLFAVHPIHTEAVSSFIQILDIGKKTLNSFFSVLGISPRVDPAWLEVSHSKIDMA